MAAVSLNVRERGKGKGNGVPLVLVHGFPFDGSMWEKQLDALGDEMWVVAPDMPGMGESAPLSLNREAGMDDYADAIADWAKSQGIEKIALAGPASTICPSFITATSLASALITRRSCEMKT